MWWAYSTAWLIVNMTICSRADATRREQSARAEAYQREREARVEAKAEDRQREQEAKAEARAMAKAEALQRGKQIRIEVEKELEIDRLRRKLAKKEAKERHLQLSSASHLVGASTLTGVRPTEEVLVAVLNRANKPTTTRRRTTRHGSQACTTVGD